MKTLILFTLTVFSGFSFTHKTMKNTELKTLGEQTILKCSIDNIDIDKKACKYVQERISLIEKFHNLEDGFSIELKSASIFLSEITNLESKSGYSYRSIGTTEENDLSMWKNWFEKNKHLLYWDDQLKTVRVR